MTDMKIQYFYKIREVMNMYIKMILKDLVTCNCLELTKTSILKDAIDFSQKYRLLSENK